MISTWEEIVELTKNAGGKIYCAPFGDFQNKKFELKKVYFDELHQEHFFTIDQCKELQLDEDEMVIKRLMKAYQSEAKLPPVILDGDLNVIDGSHRISAMFELGYESFATYVLVD